MQLLSKHRRRLRRSSGFKEDDEKTLNNRFDNPPWTLLWLRHQRDDAFWHEPEKSLDSVHVPVLLIGAFVDGYRDTIPMEESGRKEGWTRPQAWPWGSYRLGDFRTFEVQDDHPELASYIGHKDLRVELTSRELTWHTEWNLHSDTTNFYYVLRRELRENGKL